MIGEDCFRLHTLYCKCDARPAAHLEWESNDPNAGSLPMTLELKSNLVTSLEAAAAQAGLTLLSATAGSDLHGQPTAVFQLGLPGVRRPHRSSWS